jgi:small subunit ribosomal protein S9
VAEKTTNIEATGRRKTSVAHVVMIPGTGAIKINKREWEDYFRVEAMRNYVLQPLKLTDAMGKYDLSAKICGGGVSGQAGALRHAIARALVLSDKALREVLKNSGCLTRDARMKERKKPGRPGARKRFQFSKR